MNGLYSRAVLPAEIELLKDLPLGDLDGELEVTRLLLGRVLAELATIEGKRVAGQKIVAADLELTEVLTQSGGEGSPAVVATSRKRVDLHRRANNLTRTIGELEIARLRLMTEGGGKSETAREKARQIRQALDEMDRLFDPDPAAAPLSA